MANAVEGWHFAGSTLRDGSPLLDAGVDLSPLNGSTPCESGMYHTSVSAIDALKYAPGTMVARVKVWDHVVPHGTPVDKHAGRRRVGLTEYVDASEVLRDCARLYARQALSYCSAPVQDIVLRYLYTSEKVEKQATKAATDAAKAAESAWAAWAQAMAAREALATDAADAAKSAWAAWEQAAAAWAARESARAQAAAAWAATANAADLAWAARESARAAAWVRESARARQNIALELRLGELLGVVV